MKTMVIPVVVGVLGICSKEGDGRKHRENIQKS